jgi:lipoate-protein ligase A
MSSPTTPLRIVGATFADEPGLDTAISAALLERVDAGDEPETLRLYRPGRVVAFGRQDVAAIGYPAAVAAARERGFEPVERLAGGRAAVFTPSTIAFSWAIPESDSRWRTEERFEMVSEVFRDAIASMGVDARIGEVPGEYCPGRFTVNAGGRLKLMGVGQRLRRHAAHVGGVLVVADGDAINAVLTPVYAALGLTWEPAATGSLAQLVDGVTMDSALAAVKDRLAASRALEAGEVATATLERARALLGTHLSPS